MKRILIIATNHDRMGKSGQKTGIGLNEFVIPYMIWHQKGYALTVASLHGGTIPIDPQSLEEASGNKDVQEFIKTNPELLKNSCKLNDLDHKHYDAVFYPGGHGSLWDLALSRDNADFLQSFYKQHKLISAICHGPAALLSAWDPEGYSILAKHRITAFSDQEEELLKSHTLVPYVLEDILTVMGARFERAKPWTSHVIRDDNFITGQNPQSAKELAEMVAQYLDAQN